MNDTCANATAVVSFPHTQDANANAADATHCPSCAFDCAQQNHAAWYTWVAPDSAHYALNLLGGDGGSGAPLLSLWTGACGSLTPVGCSQQTFDRPIIRFTSTLGTTYHIKASQYDAMVDATYVLTLESGDVQSGDLIVGNERVYVYNGATGAIKATWPLPVTTPTAHFPDIGSQNAAGTIYLPIEIPDTIIKYSTAGAILSTFGSGLSTPHATLFNAADDLYVGYVGDGVDVRDACGDAHGGDQPPTSGYKIRRFVSDVLDATFDCAIENGGTAHLDLMADQSTMLYTSLGRTVFAYDVVGDAQLPDFATLPPATMGEMLRGLRILPDGSVLVSDTINIKRLDTDGSVIQTYSVVDQEDWGVIALTPNGQQFWVANRADAIVCPPMIAQFDVQTGDLLQTITDIPDTEGAMCSGGIMVYDGFRAAAPPLVPPVITDVTVTCGTDQLVITGTGFPVTSPSVVVSADGVPVTPIVVDEFSTTEITITVPTFVSDVTYLVMVEDSEPFSADLSCTDVVMEITHACGQNTLTLSGAFDDESEPTVTVTFNGASLTPIVVDDYSTTEINITLPTPFEDGTYCVLVNDTEPAKCQALDCGGPVPPNATTFEIRRLRRSPHISTEGHRVFHQRLEIQMQPGIGVASGQGSDPIVMLRTSSDGGNTWSSQRQASPGRIGQFLKRVQWFQLGSARDRVYEVVVTDPIQNWVIVQAWLDVEESPW